MKNLVIRCLPALAWCLSAALSTAADTPTMTRTPQIQNSFNILVWNIFMRVHPTSGDDKRWRATQIPQHMCGYDAIVLNEFNDDGIRDLMLPVLEREYPHRTRILGRDGNDWPHEQDGGVMILSRWPITNAPGQQVNFNDVCNGDLFGGSGDCLADKGALYARIRKHGQDYHVIGTHADAGDTYLEHDGAFGIGEAFTRQFGSVDRPINIDALVRNLQFGIIREFIDGLNIPATDPVFIAGDMNVNRFSTYRIDGRREYDAMLHKLDAIEASASGHPYTVDGTINSMARDRKYLDYVLLSRAHARPMSGRSEVFTPRPAQEGLGTVPTGCRIDLENRKLRDTFATLENSPIPDAPTIDGASESAPGIVPPFIREILRAQRQRRLSRSVSDHFPVFGHFVMPTAAVWAATQPFD